MRRSLAAAVRAKCKSCIYDPGHGGTWLQQVAECSSSNCPLHAVRPMPRGREKAPNSLKNGAGEGEATDGGGKGGSALLQRIFHLNGGSNA